MARQLTRRTRRHRTARDIFRQLLFEGCEDRRLLAADAAMAAEGESVELIVDNNDNGVTVEGVWSSSTYSPGFIGTDYLFKRPEPLFNPISASSEIKFTPSAFSDGNYAVFARWTSDGNRATNVPISVNHREGVAQTTVNQRINGGVWVPLGQYNLVNGIGHGVTIGADGVNGVVVADAVRLVRMGDLDPPAQASSEVIVDNDDSSGVQIDGTWIASTGITGFFDSDYLYTAIPGSSRVTFTPNLGTDGRFEVFTRWASHANRASDAPITVNHIGGSVTTDVNQRVGGGQWVSLGEFDLDTGFSNVVVGGSTANGLVVADAVRFVRVGEPVEAPEISVLRGGSEIADGGIVDFGSTTVNNPVDVTLTIRNNGSDQLNVVPPTSGALPAGFQLLSAPASSLAAGQSTTFTIRMAATSPGSFAGELLIANNDADENPYTLNLSGAVNLESAEEVIVDNDDAAGVLIEGDWRSSTSVPGFFDADYLFSPTANGKVTFTPDLSSDGLYEVSARWTSHPNRASNTPITVEHEDGMFTVQVDQRQRGGEWVLLGAFNLDDGVSNVMVGAAGVDGFPVADAVRFVRLVDVTPVPEITVLDPDGNLIADGGTLDFEQTVVGSPIDKSITIRNDGDQILTLAPLNSVVLPAGFSSTAPATSVLLPGQSVVWPLRLDAATAGTFTGTVMLTNSDGDENPFDIMLQGTVNNVATAPEITVLDSDGNLIADGGTLDFEETLVGSPINKSITIRNDGNQNLTLTPLDGLALPSGFSGTAPSTSVLAPGQSVVWSLRLDAATAGTFSGDLAIVNSDADENPFDILLQGTVNSIASPAPEITVLDSDGNVLVDGGTLDFEETVVGSPINKTITIRNDGNQNLTLTPLDGLVIPPGFSGTAPSTSVLAPGQSVVWTLRLDAAAVGSFSGNLALTNGDADENPYDILLQGSVNSIVTPGPEILVLDSSGNEIVDGGTIDFGATTVGNSLDQPITIRNSGSEDLTIAPFNPNSLPNGFAGAAPTTTLLSPGQSVVWTLRLTAADAGTFSGPFVITSNDADESPYDLTLVGTVATAPEITVLADDVEVADGGVLDFGTTLVGAPVDVTLTIRNDGDANLSLVPLDAAALPAGYAGAAPPTGNLIPGQSTVWVLRLIAGSVGTYTGNLSIVNGDGDENPFDLSLQGSVVTVLPTAPEITVLRGGSNIADGGVVSFGATTVGNPVDVDLSIRNDGDADLSLTAIDAGSLPTGFQVTSNIGGILAPGEAATLGIRLTATSGGTFVTGIGITNNDSDENPFDLTLQGVVNELAPEITVFVDGIETQDDGIVDFGLTTIGAPVTRVLIIRNDGDADLALTPLTSADLPAGFILTSGPAQSTLAPGEATAASLQLTAGAAGSFGGPISIVNSDGDENPFGLTLQATVRAPAPEIALRSGGNPLSDGGVLNFGSTLLGTPTDISVSIRNDGDAVLSIGSLDAGSLPAGFALVSPPATSTIVPGGSTSFTLRLVADSPGAFSGAIALANNDADENPYDLTLQGTVTAPEIAVLAGGSPVADGGILAFGETPVGIPIDRVLTIRNDGDAPLSLVPIDAGSLPAGFELVAQIGASSLAPGEETSLTLRLTAEQIGTPGGTLLLGNNDADENPYDIDLQGSVRMPLPEMTVLRNGVEVADGATIDFGLTPLGSPVSVSFVIRNDGEDLLSLPAINPASAPPGFQYVSVPAAMMLAPGQQTSFVLRMLASTSGSQSGAVAIANNDSDENPYDLNLAGLVADARYRGTATGTATTSGQTVPVNVPVNFLVAGSQILVIDPNGGTGTVDGSTITFGTSAAGIGACTFVGAFSGDQSSASGTWSCPAIPAGGSASGTWQATVVPEGEAEGEGGGPLYAASLSAAFEAWVDSRGDESWDDAVDRVFAEASGF